jgi:hypothetical protein
MLREPTRRNRASTECPNCENAISPVSSDQTKPKVIRIASLNAIMALRGEITRRTRPWTCDSSSHFWQIAAPRGPQESGQNSWSHLSSTRSRLSSGFTTLATSSGRKETTITFALTVTTCEIPKHAPLLRSRSLIFLIAPILSETHNIQLQILPFRNSSDSSQQSLNFSLNKVAANRLDCSDGAGKVASSGEILLQLSKSENWFTHAPLWLFDGSILVLETTMTGIFLCKSETCNFIPWKR